jgi:phosphoserine phosphatase RsbU/P
MLNVAGYDNVRALGSALEAYRWLEIGEPQTREDSPVDLVLLDIVMPEIDGIEACARIRSDARYSDIPIIMATSLGDMDSLANAFVAGATDYITKPMHRVELLARVRSALKLKSELDRRLERERELTKFMSGWGNRRAAHWVDETTGLFLGEVAEAYLTAVANLPFDGDTSVIALAIDRLDAYRSVRGVPAVSTVLAQVARAVRGTAATVGVAAAAYPNGTIVLVVPELQARPALELGERLRIAVSRLGIPNPEGTDAGHVTVSVVVVTGRVKRWIDRVHLLTRAISAVARASAAGGDRVVQEYDL